MARGEGRVASRGAAAVGAAAARSASGLRPASAFVAIGCVLAAVTARAAQIAFLSRGEQPDALRADSAPWPRFEITDGHGRPLAFSVECFDLTLSPQAMWRSHTPARMAAGLANVFNAAGESVDPDELLVRMLPPEFLSLEEHVPGESGWLAVDAPRLLRFDAAGAERVLRWLERGAASDEAPAHGPVEGFDLHRLADGGWTLAWRPLDVLTREARIARFGEAAEKRPDLWTRRLLGDLASLANAEGVAAFEAAHADYDPASRRALLRDAIWAELLPCNFRVVRRRLEPVVAHGLHDLLRTEAVSPFQMQLAPVLDRRHPVRPPETEAIVERAEWTAGDRPQPADEPVADASRDPADAFQILGHWGVLGTEDALERARHERDLEPQELDWFGLQDPVERRAWQLQTAWRPWSGLELLAHDVLADPIWSERLEEVSRGYARRVRHVSPDRRGRWTDKRVPNYYDSAHDGADVPRIETTLDAELQSALHAELLGVLDEHDAALAEAIVLDVATGDVLAVDGVYAYAISGFAPVRHVYTPGSTMKAVIMAIALDAGVVDLGRDYLTHQPDGLLLDDGRKKRRIHEAEGAPEEDAVDAYWALAKSVNAVLVQIGMQVPAPALRAKLIDLGYAARPGAGLGPEGVGYVPPLVNGTWRGSWEHASVSFGHELSVSLWQHATALATLARGGEFRPLRLVRAVEQDDARWELPLGEGRRVLSADACATVREMMALGAAEGTGRHVASKEQCPEFEYIGTKTGTTEKVPDEVSLHLEWPRQLELAEAGLPWTTEEYKRLKGRRSGRSRIYTSSICAIGRLPGDAREVMVMLVVDEPRSKAKFGSEVAGPTAISILRRAFALDPRPADAQTVDAITGAATTEDGEPAAGERLPAGAFSEDGLPWASPIPSRPQQRRRGDR